MIELKTAHELERMRRAGKTLSRLLAFLKTRIAPGLTTKALDDEALAWIKTAGVEPAFLGYRGFPASICVSVNEEVVHGIPGARVIRSGDVVSIDAGVRVEGYCADAAITVMVGPVATPVARLVAVTEDALREGIAMAGPSHRLSDISARIQETVERAGFGVVRDFVGHGIGRAIHEDPPIPNYGPPNRGPRLRSGMVLAIEPMVTMGSWQVEVQADGWTAVTKDRSLSAHFEHTVAVTEQGPEVLTA